MENLSIGTKVKAYHSYVIGLGMKIKSTTYFGEISKVNKKSIVVDFDRMLVKDGSEIVRDAKYSNKVKFDFWKSVEGRTFYRNKLYGIIEF